MSEAALPAHLSDLMSLRAKAESESPLPKAELSPVVHWVPKYTTGAAVIDPDVIERKLLEIRAKRLTAYQQQYKEFVNAL